MATTTTNLKLVKPDLTDFADIRVLNQNMDTLDNAVGGLDYIKNVTTSDSGLTFTKKDDTVVNVPLDYLKLTGGTVTGDTEFTGKLTNNSKDVGRLFCNKQPILTPLIDFDEMAKTRGTTKVTVQTTQNGKSTSISYYEWCYFKESTSTIAFETGDIILKESFTNYDKLLVVTTATNANEDIKYNTLDCGMLEWMMNNMPVVSLTGEAGNGYWVVYPFEMWGTQTKTSTATKLVLRREITDMIEIYGIKYTEAD